MTSVEKGDRDAPPYNAVVRHVRVLHDALMIIRVTPDDGVPAFTAGQYATLGLSEREPRVDGLSLPEDKRPRSAPPRLIRRAYSISCPVFDDQQSLVTVGELPFLEFYIARVAHPEDDPPKLSPRLFGLTAGSRLYLAPHIHGTYTLAPVQPDDAVVFLATGTGEAPHNAMIAELFARGHRGPIVSAVCVRFARDLGYVEVHRQLERRFDNYRYVTLTTREPQNVDASHPEFVGKQYLQQFAGSGQLDRLLPGGLNPARAHVYLCGNPDMIGLPPPSRVGEHAVPQPASRFGGRPKPAGHAGLSVEEVISQVPARGMVEYLTRRGFLLDQPHAPGNIHFEKYW